ncbi:hypothetical protein DFJ74DRAFT_689412 [Hyaloraphidium curvatum]|nr:hypothetical protein DFJ74DRAFT_689412 [Hyaloraphidium curvatum]
MSKPALPPVATAADWQAARDKLLAREKQLTRELDKLAAERRRLPMVEVDAGKYIFTAEDGSEKKLADLFKDKRQLVVYHFMLFPGEPPCVGCSGMMDNVGRLEHLEQRDATFVVASPAAQSEIGPLKKRMEWGMPWLACPQSFAEDMGAGKSFGISVFLRDGDKVYRTYFTTQRGADRLRFDFNLLDLLPYGRGENWEDSPEGWPKASPPYVWWNYHDKYGTEEA